MNSSVERAPTGRVQPVRQSSATDGKTHTLTHVRADGRPQRPAQGAARPARRPIRRHPRLRSSAGLARMPPKRPPKAHPGQETPMRPTLIAAALAALAGPALAQSPTPAFPALEPIQAAANAKPGPRTLPAHVIPPPQADLSPAAQALVAAPYRAPAWNANPPDAAELARLIGKLADASSAVPRRRRASPRRHHGDHHHRRREVLRLHPAAAMPGRPPEPVILRCPRRRLRLWPRRVRHGRGHADGGLRRLQGDRVRLPHAARRPLPRRDGRRDGRLSRRLANTAPPGRPSSAPAPAAA